MPSISIWIPAHAYEDIQALHKEVRGYCERDGIAPWRWYANVLTRDIKHTRARRHRQAKREG